jgi:teichuronic acid exporter
VSFKKTFFKNLITFGGYNYATQALRFIATIILSRLLLPAEYGFVALITVFTEYIKIFTDSGVSFAVIRSDYKHTFYKAVHSIAILIGVILFLLMVGLAFPIAYFYGDKDLIIPTIVFATVFIVQSMQVVPWAIHAKELNFNKIGQVNLIGQVISMGGMIILAYLGFSYWSLIIPQIVMIWIYYFMFNHKLKIKPSFDRRYIIIAFRKTRSLLGNISFFNSINYWARNADNLIVGKIYGKSDLGIYNRGYQFLTLALNLITGIFGTVLYPSLQKLKESGGNVNKEYTSILGVISILSLPFALPLILIPKWFVLILWGENWMGVAELLPYFGLLILGQTLISTGGHIFVLNKKEKNLALLGIIQSVSLVAGIVVGALISLKMVVICYSIAYLIIVVPSTLYLGFYKSFHFNVKEILLFWTPKLLAYFGIFYGVYFEYRIITYVFLAFLIIHIIYFQRGDLGQLFNLAKTKLKRTQNHE